MPAPALEYRPAPHCAHTVDTTAPVTAAAVPAAHSVQAPTPVLAWYWPAAQLEHDVLPPGAMTTYVPTPHATTQLVAPASDDVSVPHTVHLELP